MFFGSSVAWDSREPKKKRGKKSVRILIEIKKRQKKEH
jgi:hypothetical protein